MVFSPLEKQQLELEEHRTSRREFGVVVVVVVVVRSCTEESAEHHSTSFVAVDTELDGGSMVKKLRMLNERNKNVYVDVGSDDIVDSD